MSDLAVTNTNLLKQAELAKALSVSPAKMSRILEEHEAAIRAAGAMATSPGGRRLFLADRIIPLLHDIFLQENVQQERAEAERQARVRARRYTETGTTMQSAIKRSLRSSYESEIRATGAPVTQSAIDLLHARDAAEIEQMAAQFAVSFQEAEENRTPENVKLVNRMLTGRHDFKGEFQKAKREGTLNATPSFKPEPVAKPRPARPAPTIPSKDAETLLKERVTSNRERQDYRCELRNLQQKRPRSKADADRIQELHQILGKRARPA